MDQSILDFVIIALILFQVRTSWRLYWIERQALLMAEAIAIMEGGENSPVALQAEQIRKKSYSHFDALLG